MNSTTDTPRTDAWECFSDPSYYDMARLRRTDGPKDFNTGYHLNNLREAIEVRDTLNELERRAEKAEGEVEFWKSKTYEAEQSEGKHEAEISMWRDGGIMHEDHSNEIDELKAEVERLDHLLADASATNHKLQDEVERLAKEGELYRAANSDVKRIAEERNKAEAERDAYKKLALELCAELCQICKDPIHLKQLEELSK